LRDTGVVNPRREANNIYYRLSPEFEEFFSALIELPPIADPIKQLKKEECYATY
jgi:lipid-binding SYLF domain-containing protein